MKLYDINLLPKRKRNLADTLLTFILYYFRYIIVVTQIVVIGVFFFRFKVDQQVIDLKESFKQKQQILAVTLPIVEEARSIQLKADHIQTIIDEQNVSLGLLRTIVKSIPRDVTLTSVEVLDEEVTIRGFASQVQSVRTLHKKLSTYKLLHGVEIASIERQVDGGFDFVIHLVRGTHEQE